MLPDFFCTRHSLIDGDRQLHPQLAGDRFHFLHDGAYQRGNARIAHHLNQRGSRECADRIQRSVSQNLYPNLVADARGDRAAQAGGDERLCNSAAAFGARAARLAERNAITLDMLNHPG